MRLNPFHRKSTTPPAPPPGYTYVSPVRQRAVVEEYKVVVCNSITDTPVMPQFSVKAADRDAAKALVQQKVVELAIEKDLPTTDMTVFMFAPVQIDTAWFLDYVDGARATHWDEYAEPSLRAIEGGKTA